MPELTPEFRARAEAELSDLIQQVHGKRRQRLIDSMGWPPRITPETLALIDEIREELQQEKIAALLLLIMLNGMDSMRAATGIEIAPERAVELARELSAARAADMAEQMADTTLRQLETAASKARDEIMLGDADQLRLEFETRVESTTGDSRSQGAASDQTTAANTEGETTYRVEIRDQLPPEMELVGFWRHSTYRPPGHAGAAREPCPVCTPMLDKSEWEWELINPSLQNGPPGHPGGCDCWVEYELIPVSEANELRRRVGIVAA